MKYLLLGTNQFSGTIPTELGKLTALKILDLHQNKLVGTSAVEFATWHHLTLLDIGANSGRCLHDAQRLVLVAHCI